MDTDPYSDEGLKLQQEIHDFLSEKLSKLENGILTGWVIAYEIVREDSPTGTGSAGHMFGPMGMTSWRALGLVKWIEKYCLLPGFTPPDIDFGDDTEE